MILGLYFDGRECCFGRIIHQRADDKWGNISRGSCHRQFCFSWSEKELFRSSFWRCSMVEKGYTTILIRVRKWNEGQQYPSQRYKELTRSIDNLYKTPRCSCLRCSTGDAVNPSLKQFTSFLEQRDLTEKERFRTERLQTRLACISVLRGY